MSKVHGAVMSRVGVAVMALSVAACVTSEVTYTGAAKYPANPKGCPVKIFPSATPDYKWEDLATVQANCHHWLGRSACVEELKKQVCGLGGDTLYSFKDGTDGGMKVMIGTVGRRTRGKGADAPTKDRGESLPKGSGDTLPAPAPAPAQAPGCDPPCSPGYKCSADGQCLPLCNPPCGEGMRCNQQRACESAAPAPSK